MVGMLQREEVDIQDNGELEVEEEEEEEIIS